MMTVGVDIGGKQHALARCREGQDKADREILRVSQDRAGFERLDAWLAAQDEPVGRIAMESSGHYWMCPASISRGTAVGHGGQPARSQVLCQEPDEPHQVRPGRCEVPRAMAQHDHSPVRDPLAGVELRQASRFAMRRVTEQARVCQRLIRLVELGFPELGELFADPACRTARGPDAGTGTPPTRRSGDHPRGSESNPDLFYRN